MGDESVVDTVAAEKYKNVSRNDHKDRQKEIENVDNNKLNTRLRDNDITVEQYTKNRQELLAKLVKSQKMCGRHMDHIGMAKHHIKRTAPDVPPINSASYDTGENTRGLEKAKIDKMLCMNFRESAQPECTSRLVFASKKDGSLQFCI